MQNICSKELEILGIKLFILIAELSGRWRINRADWNEPQGFNHKVIHFKGQSRATCVE